MVERLVSPPRPKLLSKRAVSEILGVHEQTVMRHVRLGKFPRPLSMGNRGSAVRFYEEDVLAWIDAKRAQRDWKPHSFNGQAEME